MFKFLKTLFKAYGRTVPVWKIQLNADGISLIVSGIVERRIGWNDIRRVLVVTTDDGPFLDDFFYVFECKESCIFVPPEWQQRLNLIEVLQARLQGIHFESMIEAAGSVEV